jgi:hypothetical protein
LLPILKSPKLIPSTIEARNTCTKQTVTITGASHFPENLITKKDSIMCQNVHNRKLPSWPSQKQENIYSKGSVVDECCHT